MLVYDHCKLVTYGPTVVSIISHSYSTPTPVLTFPQEVERIWKQRFTVASILFLINRYVTILQFIILLLGECCCTGINNGESDVVWQHSIVLTGHTGFVHFLLVFYICSQFFRCTHSHLLEKFTLTRLWRSCPRFVHFEGASTVSLVAIGQRQSKSLTIVLNRPQPCCSFQ